MAPQVVKLGEGVYFVPSYSEQTVVRLVPGFTNQGIVISSPNVLIEPERFTIEGIREEEGMREEREPDQSWFWAEKWQEGEHRVEEHIRQGEVETFEFDGRLSGRS